MPQSMSLRADRSELETLVSHETPRNQVRRIRLELHMSRKEELPHKAQKVQTIESRPKSSEKMNFLNWITGEPKLMSIPCSRREARR